MRILSRTSIFRITCRTFQLDQRFADLSKRKERDKDGRFTYTFGVGEKRKMFLQTFTLCMGSGYVDKINIDTDRRFSKKEKCFYKLKFQRVVQTDIVAEALKTDSFKIYYRRSVKNSCFEIERGWFINDDMCILVILIISSARYVANIVLYTSH